MIQNDTNIFLYLGGKGQNQEVYTKTQNPALGGWNFGGNGGVETNPEEAGPPENGAGGGGAIDIRLQYADINNKNLAPSIWKKSIESRIIVAGSGGGAASAKTYSYGSADGYPGGTISAASNKPYTNGGTQKLGTLGKGLDGISTNENNAGGSGGNGSGYRGGYNSFPKDTSMGYLHIGGSGGSSYISGHFGCISPNFEADSQPTLAHSIHESGFYFTHTEMKSGNESMPNPFSESLMKGNIGNGVCRITLLSIFKISCFISPNFNYFFSFIFLTLISK